MKRIRNKITYANVVSTLCLFLLVGGGAAWAAIHLPKNSVGAQQLKKGAVTPTKLSKSTKTALKGATGPQGPQGPAGAPATALWAHVSSTGTLGKNKGAVSSFEPFGAGTYQVDFNQDVTGCTYQATSSSYPAMFVLVEPRDKDPTGVYVETTETVKGSSVNDGFDLAVFC